MVLGVGESDVKGKGEIRDDDSLLSKKAGTGNPNGSINSDYNDIAGKVNAKVSAFNGGKDGSNKDLN